MSSSGGSTGSPEVSNSMVMPLAVVGAMAAKLAMQLGEHRVGNRVG